MPVGMGYYHPGMAVKKLSVALDDAVAQEVALAAERAGVSVSAWLNHAAENELAIEAGLDAVREWEAEHGELTAKELAAADKLLDRVLDGARRQAEPCQASPTTPARSSPPSAAIVFSGPSTGVRSSEGYDPRFPRVCSAKRGVADHRLSCPVSSGAAASRDSTRRGPEPPVTRAGALGLPT